jgi:hypothetical protein
MTGTAIIDVSIRRNAATDGLLTKTGPTLKFVGTVHDYFVPRLGLAFDRFSVPEQSNARKIRRY